MDTAAEIAALKDEVAKLRQELKELKQFLTVQPGETPDEPSTLAIRRCDILNNT